MVTVIAFVIVLSILVLIHELGHYITAKKLGIKVEEFGFGFPPRLFGKRIGETVYSINLLPVGGFVKLYGEDEAGGGKVSKKSGEKGVKEDVKRAYFARPIWQRFSVVVAGVVMNFLLAVVIISYLFAAQGVAVPTNTVTVTEISENSPAEQAGLLVGDQVVAMNDSSIKSTEDFIALTQQNLGEEVELDIRRNGEIVEVQLTPRENPPEGDGAIGVGISSVDIKKYAWYEAPFYGTLEALKFSALIVQGLGQMIFDLVTTGQRPEGVAGPIGVAQLTGEAVSFGVNATLWFLALLSLNLAVLNIMPVPALDGGRLFFIIIEAVTRRKVNQKYETYAHVAGLIILLSLMALITVVDIGRLFSGESLIPEM